MESAPVPRPDFRATVQRLVKSSFGEMFNATIKQDQNGRFVMKNISFIYSDKVKPLSELIIEIESEHEQGWTTFVQVLAKFVLLDSGSDIESLKSSKIWVLLFIAGIVMNKSRDSLAEIQKFRQQVSTNRLRMHAECNGSDESELISFILLHFEGDPVYYKDVLINIMCRIATFVMQFPATIIGEKQNWHYVIQVICEKVYNYLENESIDRARKEKLGQDKLFVEALKCWSKYHEKYQVDSLYDPANRLQYRLGFYAHQCLIKLLPNEDKRNFESRAQKVLNATDRTKHVLLSKDSLAAASLFSGNFRAKFAISEHCYYEVIIFSSDNLMVFGFDMLKIDRLCGSTIGNDTFSIGFSPVEQCIRFDKKKFGVDNPTKWEEGDVVGCLLNVASKKVKFYFNGKRVLCKELKLFEKPQIHRKADYLAAVSLFGKAMCYFNFGQAPFKYGPNLAEKNGKKTKLACV